MTTAAAMDAKPLSMAAAWRVHDKLFEDERVEFFPEPAGAEVLFRQYAARRTTSPKIWADVAFSRAAGGVLVTFDRALTERGARCLLPE